MQKVVFGFFSEFAEPTMLFAGSQSSLRRFAALVRSFSTHRPLQVELHAHPDFATIRGTKVNLVTKQDGPAGIRMLRSIEGDHEFVWRLTPANANRFGELIEAVANAAAPCHHYLDTNDSDDVTVVVSREEYDDLISRYVGTGRS